MLNIGITGGIGSGKSTVCKIFETLGIPVYYADEQAKLLMRRDPHLIRAIKDLLGNDVYDRHGVLNTKRIASLVFGDPEKLHQLNQIVHPATIRDAAQWAQRQVAPYTLKEAALMFESESFHAMDKVIGVYAPQSLRIQRTMHRDGISREEVLKRMDNQLDETIKMRLCDYVIHNDEQHLVILQVLELHDTLLQGSTSS